MPPIFHILLWNNAPSIQCRSPHAAFDSAFSQWMPFFERHTEAFATIQTRSPNPTSGLIAIGHWPARLHACGQHHWPGAQSGQQPSPVARARASLWHANPQVLFLA